MIALVDAERQISLLHDEAASTVMRLSQPSLDGALWASWGVPRESWSWSLPTWSPDGRWIAAFRTKAEEPDKAGRAVFLLDPGGLRDIRLFDLDSRIPVYLQWSPDGRRLAILTQQTDHLELFVVTLGGTPPQRPIAQGSPLFFNWLNGDQVVAYVGAKSRRDSTSQGRIALLHAEGGRPETVLPGRPGAFCAPVVVGGEVVYVRRDDKIETLVSWNHRSGYTVLLEATDGLVAILPCLDDPPRTVIRAIAPGGDGTPYRSIVRVDLRNGEQRRGADASCLAVLPLPEHLGEVLVQVDTARNRLDWVRIDASGEKQLLTHSYPTREQRFYLRFFEQFVPSHPIVSADGQHLLVAGSLEGWSESLHAPQVFSVNLTTGEIATLADACLGVFSPHGIRETVAARIPEPN
jgi:hypothetical protein